MKINELAVSVSFN